MATRTWYDSECVPFARSVVGTIRDTGKSGPKYELLEVRLPPRSHLII